MNPLRVVFLLSSLSICALSEEPAKPGPELLFNGWGFTPAGVHQPVSDLPLKMIIAPDGKVAVAVCAGFSKPGLAVVSLADQKVAQFVDLPHTWNGLCFANDGKRLFVSGGASGVVYVFSYQKGRVEPLPEVKLEKEGVPLFIAGIAVQPATGRLYVCNEANNEVWVLNAETLAVEHTIAVGEHPHTCVFGADSRYLYVSDWGSRAVTVVDTKTSLRLRDLSVGIRPNDMALSPDGRLFVACSGDNTVHVIQTRTVEKPGAVADSSRRLWDGTREIISTSLQPDAPEGSTPDALAVSPDGKTLFVANADNNAVMVVDISGSKNEEGAIYAEKVSVVNGFIPVGWYPTALVVTPDNRTLLVGDGKGVANLGPSFPADKPRPQPGEKFSFIHPGKLLQGDISFIARPDTAQMAAYTAQVVKNSPYKPDSMERTAMHSTSVIPDKVGAPCPIKYVLYIIKENRTYDQVMGDMTDAAGKPIGNGDASITMYGEDVTPNQHQLARDYVLLDNLYCNGEVSVDGHSWCDAAIATDYNERSWILSYSSRKEKLPGNDEMETPSAGYLWDLCKRHGISYKNYGEGAQRVPSINRGKWSGKRDTDRVENWIADLKKAEEMGKLPRFTIMSLGENHTQGTTPGAHTPDAAVGSNDVALGRIVAAASRSKFWNEMAIFVIEDDAQNGPDHVDAHRTVGLVISPYIKRHSVDGTLYSTASMVRTMELILGLPPMTQYDGGATPMFASFGQAANSEIYEVKTPKVDLEAVNAPTAPGAKRSAKMDFREYDRAPEDELNRILWVAAKGPEVPYPAPIHRVFISGDRESGPVQH
ncbi:MAG: bifunctional YncE family protein/alkaline phosphatase family protein [Chthoniobacter sp.]|nr:bifunctional YncE family protein/alkaline phosphatase family protein [Chthoniobacter sp.]